MRADEKEKKNAPFWHRSRRAALLFQPCGLCSAHALQDTGFPHKAAQVHAKLGKRRTRGGRGGGGWMRWRRLLLLICRGAGGRVRWSLGRRSERKSGRSVPPRGRTPCRRMGAAVRSRMRKQPWKRGRTFREREREKAVQNQKTERKADDYHPDDRLRCCGCCCYCCCWEYDLAADPRLHRSWPRSRWQRC